MKRWLAPVFASLLVAVFGATVDISAEDPSTSARVDEPHQATGHDALPSVEQARGEAELLHEALHATLQIVHHQYFREDEGIRIPAATLKSVFRELARHQNVEARWLVVDGQAMNTDHKPRNAFEKAAAKALASGEDSYEVVEDGVYRRAGSITLGGDCLKCHVPNRTSLEDRAAGLVISIPIQGK